MRCSDIVRHTEAPPGSQSNLTSSSGNGKWRTIGLTAARVAVSECGTLEIISMYEYD
jgi:hypothetical protein